MAGAQAHKMATLISTTLGTNQSLGRRAGKAPSSEAREYRGDSRPQRRVVPVPRDVGRPDHADEGKKPQDADDACAAPFEASQSTCSTGSSPRTTNAQAVSSRRLRTRVPLRRRRSTGSFPVSRCSTSRPPGWVARRPPGRR